MQDDRVDYGVTMQVALDHYKINWLRKIGTELRGRCPIHQCGGNIFRVDLTTNSFQCFCCEAHGDVLAFVAEMEKCTNSQAAQRLQRLSTVGTLAQ